jgi:ER-bound oxygenase mpaB/B'/Rubber oxygenase, catalytic domain
MFPKTQTSFLDENRLIGDSYADGVIIQLMQKRGHAYLKELMAFLGNVNDLDYSTQDEILQNYLKSASLPEWADTKRIDNACRIFKSYFIPIGVALGCYALPYCYLAEDGAQVLYLSQRIKTDTTARIMETADFVNGVLKKEDWHNGKNLIRIMKVRLIHAVVRGFAYRNPNWQKAWGIPINQEDMAGTNLAFSYVLTRGLKRMGYHLKLQEQEDYIYIWAVIGNLQGIRYELLPQNIQEAKEFDELIAKRHFKESEVGKDLMNALVKGLEGIKPVPFIKNLPAAQARILLGKEYADMLGMKNYPIEGTFIKMMNGLNSLYNYAKILLKLDRSQTLINAELKVYKIFMPNTKLT